MKRCSEHQASEHKLEQAEKSIEDLLTSKMKDEADIAEYRSIIEELETKLARYEKGKDETKKSLEILE